MKIPPNVALPTTSPSSTASSLLSANKKLLLITAIALAALYLYKYRSETVSAKMSSCYNFSKRYFSKTLYLIRPGSRPAYTLTVNCRSCLQYAKIAIQIPENHPPAKANFLFCVDTSGTSEGGRETAVREGIKSSFISAVALQEKGWAETTIAIVEFNSDAKIVCPPIQVRADTIESVRNMALIYKNDGKTDSLKGFNVAAETLEAMARSNPEATNTLFFFSNGKDKVAPASLANAQKRLSAIGAKIFAIGTGTGYRQKTLQRIAPSTPDINGTYINASADSATIASSVFIIYERTMHRYTHLILRCPQLKSGTWSLDEQLSKPARENPQESENPVVPVLEGQKVERTIRLYPSALSGPLDLSKLSFVLTYKNYRGEAGSVPFAWNPTHIVVPDPNTL